MTRDELIDTAKNIVRKMPDNDDAFTSQDKILYIYLREFLNECKKSDELVKALEFYAAGDNKMSDIVGTRIEFGCGCCAGTIEQLDGYTDCDHDDTVIGLTAREALAKYRGEL